MAHEQVKDEYPLLIRSRRCQSHNFQVSNDKVQLENKLEFLLEVRVVYLHHHLKEFCLINVSVIV